jgi:hypothetical protein
MGNFLVEGWFIVRCRIPYDGDGIVVVEGRKELANNRECVCFKGCKERPEEYILCLISIAHNQGGTASAKIEWHSSATQRKEATSASYTLETIFRRPPRLPTPDSARMNMRLANLPQRW